MFNSTHFGEIIYRLLFFFFALNCYSVFFSKDIEKGDLDTWQNIRGPRPWEDSKTYQVAERQRMAEGEGQRNS